MLRLTCNILRLRLRLALWLLPRRARPLPARVRAFVETIAW